MQETLVRFWVRKIRWRWDRLPTPVFLGFLCCSVGKESACNAGDLGSIPGLGRSPGEGKGYPLQYSGLENSMDCIIQGAARVGHNWVTFTFTFLVCENIRFVPVVLADKYHIETLKASGCVYAATGVRRLSTCESTQVRQRCGEALGQGRTLPSWVFCWAPGYQGCWVRQAVIDFVANLRDQGCNLKHPMFF